jgi:hypothetical protein
MCCSLVLKKQDFDQTLMSVFESLWNKLADPSSLRYSPGTRTSSTPVSPIFSTSSASASTLENLTRTIRGYVHSSIPIPTSPPSNSRVVAIGTSSRLPPRQDRASQQEFERDYELDNEEDNEYYGDDSKPHYHPVLQLSAGHHSDLEVPSGRQPMAMMGSSGLAQAMQRNIDTAQKPPPGQVEAIIWARWDVLHERYAFPFLLWPL